MTTDNTGQPGAAHTLGQEEQQKAETNAAANTDWGGQLDPQLAKMVQHKGWQSPADALKSYHHLEKMMGADKAGRAVILPSGPDDQESYEKIYRALGRPDKPEEYDLSSVIPEGPIDPNFIKTMSAQMHQAGLSKSQAHNLAQAYQTEIMRHLDTNRQKQAHELEDIKRDWGRDYDRRVECARQAVVKFGFSNEELNGIESAFGPKVLFEKLYRIGEALAEDRPAGSAPESGNFSVSPGEARGKIKELLSDPNFKTRYLAGEQEALKKIEALSLKASHG